MSTWVTMAAEGPRVVSSTACHSGGLTVDPEQVRLEAAAPEGRSAVEFFVNRRPPDGCNGLRSPRPVDRNAASPALRERNTGSARSFWGE